MLMMMMMISGVEKKTTRKVKNYLMIRKVTCILEQETRTVIY